MKGPKGLGTKPGQVQVYTGDGKGKTTAALGLAMRAAGAGFRVMIVQFLKLGDYSEIKALGRIGDLIALQQFGTGHFMKGSPTAEDVAAAGRGVQALEAALTSGEYDLVIADEANVAVHRGLFPIGTLMAALQLRRPETELVITGRYAHPRIVELADLVTEMKAVKHYFKEGVLARTGIEK